VKFLKVMFPALTILLQIKPSHVRRLLSLKVFGKEEYGPDDKSTERRANSIEFDKKALSYFMPRNKIAWDDLTQMGNPTRSTEVNELIEHVKTLEGRGRGKKSQARREITLHEFKMLVGALRKMAEGDGPAGELVAYATVGVLTFMWHAIARGDDSMQLQSSVLSYDDELESVKMKMGLLGAHSMRKGPGFYLGHLGYAEGGSGQEGAVEVGWG
jgi:hypothetical protein